jgi:very-short-patch-repair endonuclease
VLDWAASLPPTRANATDKALIELLSGPSTVDFAWCESPIETAMLRALLDCQLNTDRKLFWKSPRPTLFQQVPMSTEDGEFRLDFAMMRPVGPYVVRLVVEVDGFDVHHGSVDAVDRDNRRTRALAKRGWMVIRFSGSEITHDAGRCALEAMGVMIDNIDRAESARRK